VETLKLIECPRDAWQALPQIIPPEVKASYLAKLLAAGFRHLDAVSFVSPKHVPQMADSEEVLQKLEAVLRGESGADGLPGKDRAAPEIIGIVVNEMGLQRALAAPRVTTIGYPYSISAYFRRANANMSRDESRALVKKLQQHTSKAGQDLVVYISMAFANPYDEPWGPEIVADTLRWLKEVGVRTISLADTVGKASAQQVGELFSSLREASSGVEVGVHLYSRRESAAEKVLAAYDAGCRRFDSAIGGLGGCPFAGDELVGNIPTEIVVKVLEGRGLQLAIDSKALAGLVSISAEIRTVYGQAASATIH
jgi:hydroxymethylglutaryl-CoA lyase